MAEGASVELHVLGVGIRQIRRESRPPNPDRQLSPSRPLLILISVFALDTDIWSLVIHGELVI
jgi:hypothetical protein